MTYVKVEVHASEGTVHTCYLCELKSKITLESTALGQGFQTLQKKLNSDVYGSGPIYLQTPLIIESSVALKALLINIDPVTGFTSTAAAYSVPIIIKTNKTKPGRKDKQPRI